MLPYVNLSLKYVILRRECAEESLSLFQKRTSKDFKGSLAELPQKIRFAYFSGTPGGSWYDEGATDEVFRLRAAGSFRLCHSERSEESHSPYPKLRFGTLKSLFSLFRNLYFLL